MNLKDLLTAAEATEKSDKSNNSLFCCILGPSGSGKSHSIGTLNGKTLYVYFSGEKHGVSSAKKEGLKNIIPLCIDYVEGKELTPDETLNRLRQIIKCGSDLVKEGFTAIAIDGLTEIDLCITQTKELKTQCLTNQGKVDGFRTSTVAKQMVHSLIKSLVTLQQQTGLHIITTCILDVQEYGENKEIESCSPRLSTYGLAENALQMFPDRVVVGPQYKESGEEVYVFDSSATIAKVSKDVRGVVKKMFNFSPRLGSGELPKLMKANLSELISLKRG